MTDEEREDNEAWEVSQERDCERVIRVEDLDAASEAREREAYLRGLTRADEIIQAAIVHTGWFDADAKTLVTALSDIRREIEAEQQKGATNEQA